MQTYARAPNTKRWSINSQTSGLSVYIFFDHVFLSHKSSRIVVFIRNFPVRKKKFFDHFFLSCRVYFFLIEKSRSKNAVFRFRSAFSISHKIGSNAGFYGDKILNKNLKFFDKLFVPTFCRRRFRNALYGEKILSMGKCYGWARFRQTCLGSSMRGRYKI